MCSNVQTLDDGSTEVSTDRFWRMSIRLSSKWNEWRDTKNRSNARNAENSTSLDKQKIPFRSVSAPFWVHYKSCFAESSNTFWTTKKWKITIKSLTFCKNAWDLVAVWKSCKMYTKSSTLVIVWTFHLLTRSLTLIGQSLSWSWSLDRSQPVRSITPNNQINSNHIS